jgi:hypothetical protein
MRATLAAVFSLLYLEQLQVVNSLIHYPTVLKLDNAIAVRSVRF